MLALPPRITQRGGGGGARLLIRVHYARACTGASASPGWLALMWRTAGPGGGEGEEDTVVPAAAFSTALSGAQEQREAMRRRLYEPRVPWQTYVHSSMAAHTLQPTGLVLRLGFTDVGASSAPLAPSSAAVDLGPGGHIAPWPRFSPAHVIPGRHSLNGSDYTSFVVRGWGRAPGEAGAAMVRRNASVTFETTTTTASGQPCGDGAAGERCDLLAVATCVGADCANLALSVSGSYEWGRSGQVALRPASGSGPNLPDSATGLAFRSPGFPTVTAFPAANSTLVRGLAAPASADRLLLRFGGCGARAGVSTGRGRRVADMVALVAAARRRADVLPPRLAGVAALALPMFDVLAWNTLFTTSLHVYTPVSRNWAGGNDDAATTFVWDVFFAAVMLGCAGPGHQRAADIAYANVITTVFSRTTTGMVPNYRSGIGGSTCTYDRSEPMVGAWSLQILHSVFADDWVAELLFAPLYDWNTWVHERRSAEGILGAGRPGGKTALVSLGSDATTPPGQNTPHTLAASRYESGLDNSPQYDGNDGPGGNEGFGVGPVRFNATTSHMELYDVAFTVYHALDSRALLALGGVAGAGASDLAALRARAAATEQALHRDLFDASAGSYANRLYNGSFYHRWAPTIFSPLLLNSTPAERVSGMMDILGDPATFCVAGDSEGHNATTFLWRMAAAHGGYLRRNQSVTCSSAACLQSTVLGVADFGGIEAVVDVSRSGVARTPLRLFTDGAQFPDACLSSSPPSQAFALVNASAPPEGWCAPAATGAYTQPLVLWHNKAAGDHRTCGGTAACAPAAMEAAGYENAGTLCYARAADSPAAMPCRYGLPSIGRSDSAFWDQLYWRGRIWAPQIYLVWAGLQRYDGVPAARLRRAQLAGQAERLFRQQLDLFGQVNENMNGVLGVGSDSVRADSYYHWGALNALVAIAERGLYPSPLLAGSHSHPHSHSHSHSL